MKIAICASFSRWSFGVLLWEIVTFGSKPYSDVPTGDLYLLLNNGYRMPQPDGVDDKTYNLLSNPNLGNLYYKNCYYVD